MPVRVFYSLLKMRYTLLTDSFLETILKGHIESNAFNIKVSNDKLTKASKSLKIAKIIPVRPTSNKARKE